MSATEQLKWIYLILYYLSAAREGTCVPASFQMCKCTHYQAALNRIIPGLFPFGPTGLTIPTMKYTIDKKERYAIIKLEEENLNSAVAPELKSEFVILSNEGIPNLILDLSSVKYVDSSGLSSILTANRLWKSLGTFVLTGVKHDAVRKLIEISRLDTVLTIIPTVEESVDYVFMEDIERTLRSEKG